MNIVGEGINKTISEQIKKRQEIYGSLNRTPEQLEYLNARTAFAKLISSVDIKDTFKPTSSELKGILNSIQGSNLARDFVLFNGTQDADLNNTRNTQTSQRSGIARNNSVLNGNAYGLGGLEFGLRAMPGIISATTKSENRGSLRTTTVQIKAWNRTQFEIIDLLYLRLGYSILFEFGNTVYFQNDGTLIRNRPWSLEDTFLAGKYTVSSILKKIQEIRIKSNGNYDAVYGKVVNFSWQFLEDGSYDITVIIRSVGDVIESLRTNVLVSDSNPSGSVLGANGSEVSTEEETPTIESYADKHQIGKLLADAKNALASTPNPIVGGCRYASTNLFNGIKGVEGKKHFIQQDYTGGESQYYIRLGSLLAFIENRVVPKYESGDNEGEPILNFDYAQPTSVTFGSGVTGEVYVDKNYIYTIPNQISMDPRVCLINTSITSGAGNLYTYASQGEPYVEKVAEYDVGKVMNIYVNFMYILGTMDANLDKDDKVSLISLLTEILTGISKALGSINSLEPFIDEVENIVRVTDQSSLPGKYDILSAIGKVKPDDTVILDLYGYYNRKGEGSSAGFVRNFGIKTEITPNLATMLSIGAQAAGAVVGEDATGFSKLNEGLEDRIKNDVVDAITKTDKAKSKLEELNERFPKANRNFSEAAFQLGSLNGSVPTWDAENINSYSQLQSDFLTYQNTKQAIKNSKPSPSTPFIPINLNLVLDGLSGLKIYNALRVDTSYLPSNYPTSMDFIITGLNHTIQNNVWTTEINTNMVPRDPSQAAGGSYKGKSSNNSPSGTPSPPPRGESRGRWPYYSDSDSVPSDIESPSKGTPPVDTLKVSFSSKMKEEYIPTINTINGYSKGLKLLAATMAQKEGFYKGTRSYRTNNPGNIGNTDSGANNDFKTLKDGIIGQLDYLKKVANGEHKAYPVGQNKDIKPYYSPEIDKNQDNYQLTPYLPGYKFTPYTGTLEQFVKIYATGARGGNSYLSTIMSFFKQNGLTITPKTTLAEIAKIEGKGTITA
jgi:hypothetical protein